MLPTMSPAPAPPRAVTVLLGDPSLPDRTKRLGRFAEEDLDVIERMQAALESLGRYRLRYLTDHEHLFADLQADPPAFVLNLCDTGFRNVPTQELHVAALLELLGIPYSGATPAAMVICYDKALVSAAAHTLGIPVPAERYFETAADAAREVERFALPALIKPNEGDGSVGINARAVVHTAAEARAYLDWLGATLPGRAVLVQEYLPGRELSVGLIGNPEDGLEPLPLLEADFSQLPPGCAPILCYESKAEPDSPYWSGVRYREAALPPAERERLVADAHRLFRRLALRDYARFDYRTDAAGTVKLMEVNPNPAWGFDGKLALMAGFAGRTYAQALERLIETALRRIDRERTGG
jgi:D-alanine-D-alanine ligase